ncbi:MAG: MtrB/PioB family outer membrane beta-barrel protein [Acidobacteria bacterium]|nr:MtrB/PioB family outer membrane beta-barrel protein [Acidobacteriota bacterium]
MRTRVMILAAALLLASANQAAAQPKAADPAPVIVGLTGTIDFGVRSESTTGDEARYERYRDLRQGAFSQISLSKNTDEFKLNIRAENIGYHDQRYSVNYTGGKAKVIGSWDSTPLNYSYLTTSPWVETSTGVFSLDAAARTAVQNKVAGVVGVPQNAASLTTPSIFLGLAKPFDLQSRRDTAALAVSYNATENLGINLSATSTKKGGNQPYGMSFSFNNANELAMPLDNRANDFSAGLEYANSQGMIRVGWDGSWFDNKIHEIIWDNPLRATDTNPYDASGYSNGNGPARGRMSLPPTSSMNVFSTTGLYKMPSHTTISGVVSFTSMNQNDTLIPWTINPVIANANVYKRFPSLATLPRNTAEAEVHGVNAMFNFTSRPNNFFGLAMRYRFNDHKNLTPEFDATEYVRFDAVPEETGGPTEQFNIRENTFDLTGTFNILPHTALRLGYIYDDFNRTGRAFSDMRDYTLRASLDTVGNQYVMIRGTYDHTTRVGSGFSQDAIEEGGAQPGLRFYDEADRDRNKGTLLFVVTPVEMVDVTFSVAAGKDVYNGPGHDFGLLNNTNTAYNAGINLNPSKHVGFGANYGYEKFSSLQNSRNANPPGSDYGSWTDPNRVWNLTNDETVNNVDVYLDLNKLLANTNLRFSYDYSDSDNAFVHSGPRVQELLTNTPLTPGDVKPCAAGVTSCFQALPNVTNKWHRFSADLKYFFTKQVGVGLGYWYEKFDVTDYATNDLIAQPGTPRVANLGELSTGYGNRPYRGSTGFFRLLYSF